MIRRRPPAAALYLGDDVNMIHFFKDRKDQAATRVESAWDLGALRKEIERSRCAIDTARSNFEEVVDPTMIDCFIYELNAAQLRYQFLLRKFKKREA